MAKGKRVATDEDIALCVKLACSLTKKDGKIPLGESFRQEMVRDENEEPIKEIVDGKEVNVWKNTYRYSWMKVPMSRAEFKAKLGFEDSEDEDRAFASAVSNAAKCVFASMKKKGGYELHNEFEIKFTGGQGRGSSAVAEFLDCV